MKWTDIVGHDRPKQILRRILENQALAHAYLFFGEESIGKRLTADVFGQSVQCQGQDSHSPCGQCDGCRAFEAKSHPDVTVVFPETTQIKIDQIRFIQEALIYRPLMGTRKIVIMDHAEAMNAQAANAFLKTLEEPPAQSLMLLISSNPNRLPGTIRSRCQSIRFTAPRRSEIVEWISQKKKLPQEKAEILAALSMGKTGVAATYELDDLKSLRHGALESVQIASLKSTQRVFQLAKSCSTDATQWLTALYWIELWIRDLLVARFSPDTHLLINIDLENELKQASRQFSLESLLRSIDLLRTIENNAHRNLNRTLSLETILLELRAGLEGPSP